MSRLALILLPLLWSCTQPTDPAEPCVDEMVQIQTQGISIYTHDQPLIEACGALDWPTSCRLAWLTCTPNCSPAARWTCYQAMCAQVDEMVDCNPMARDPYVTFHMNLAAAGRLGKIENFSAALVAARLEESLRLAQDLRRLPHEQSPEALRWGLLTIAVQRLTGPYVVDVGAPPIPK